MSNKRTISPFSLPLSVSSLFLSFSLTLCRWGKPGEWSRVTYRYLNEILIRQICKIPCTHVIIVSMFYFIIIFQCRYALRTQLWREMRKNVRLKTRKIARSDKKHPTKGVKGQTWKKAVMCFVKDLLRYQKKQKVKFTLYFQAKLLETTNLQGPVVQNGNYIHTYIHTLY